MNMDTNEKINVMLQMISDIRNLDKGTQNLVINHHAAQNKELEELKAEINSLQRVVNKLELKVDILTKDGRFKRDYKDYTPEEVYNLRYSPGMTLSKVAKMLNCSKTTIQNMCKQHREALFADMNL